MCESIKNEDPPNAPQTQHQEETVLPWRPYDRRKKCGMIFFHSRRLATIRLQPRADCLRCVVSIVRGRRSEGHA